MTNPNDVDIPKSIRRVPRLAALMFGAPKSGKTTLACEFPHEGEMVYVACDPACESMRAVPERCRPDPKRILTPPIKKSGSLYYAWLMKIATKDWAAEGVDLIVWDTVTAAADALLSQCAIDQVFSEKHIKLGVGVDATPLPQMGDYRTAQEAIKNVTLTLIHAQPKVNVLLLAHTDYIDMKDGATGLTHTVGGPRIVGKAMIESYPSIFDNVIRTQAKGVNSDGVLGTEYGVWITANSVFAMPGVRRAYDATAHTSPYTNVTGNPAEFWVSLRHHIGDN